MKTIAAVGLLINVEMVVVNTEETGTNRTCSVTSVAQNGRKNQSAFISEPAKVNFTKQGERVPEIFVCTNEFQ